jgi:hypothetical protein
MTTFGSHLDRILYALGDPSEGTWSRTNEVWHWLIEAIREFPILRPMQADISDETDEHVIALPSDFKEIVAVQWPITDDMRYHTRRSRFSQDFYDGDYYDVDRDYASGAGWVLWMGQAVDYDQPCRVDYLAEHDDNASENMVLTIPDQYLNVLTEYCIYRAWTSRLSKEIANPSAFIRNIDQITEAMNLHRSNYLKLLDDISKEMSTSKIVPNRTNDKYDRIY